MIKEDEFNLLIDLVKLLKKYGPETFHDLGDSLTSAKDIKNISILLKKVSNEYSTIESPPKKKVAHKKGIVKEKGIGKPKPKSYEEDRSLNAWSSIILNDKTKDEE
jgi:hypothetical protein